MKQSKHYRIDYDVAHCFIDTAIVTATSKAEAQRKIIADRRTRPYKIVSINEITPEQVETLSKYYRDMKVIA